MGSLAQGQRILVDSPYRHGVRVGQTLAEAEHALAATVLWHLRVLAGWQPRVGASALRLLAGWFEIANISGHARAVSGAAVEPSFQLGALGMAWSRLRTTSSLAELRRVLTQSLWGDPGGDSPSDIALGVQLAWAFRVATGVPEAGDWACGGAAVLVARRLLLEGRPLAHAAQATAERILGRASMAAHNLQGFSGQLSRAPAGLWPARPMSASSGRPSSDGCRGSSVMDSSYCIVPASVPRPHDRGGGRAGHRCVAMQGRAAAGRARRRADGCLRCGRLTSRRRGGHGGGCRPRCSESPWLPRSPDFATPWWPSPTPG